MDHEYPLGIQLDLDDINKKKNLTLKFLVIGYVRIK